MPIVDGDWVEDFTAAGSTREVAAREMVYELRAVSGLTATLLGFIGGKWATIDTLTAVSNPKSQKYERAIPMQFILTGTGTATVVLSPDVPMVG